MRSFPFTETELSDLAARIRAGDIDAFHRVFEAWFPSLVTLSYHYLGSRDAAKDVAQDTFVDLWNTRSQWQWTGDIYGYLQLLVRRKSLNMLRRLQVELRHETAFLADAVSPGSASSSLRADEALIQREFWDAVISAVKRLPPRTRAVALLRWFEGVGRAETAKELGVSVRTVDAQLRAAGQAVVRWLREGGHERL